ncbi:diacylglycerol kinase family protein [Alkalibacillus haloalkaliphilus]|uniref:diacylglycerol kinase family protein n=1 Tax=Alkalibacillus haloalkaliphilus TaxID=94136 RepID=UPI002936BCF0|nr:diacylglycerol kinase family protein [Alkalibacillus haloalkaliphilus]MDV2581020.1 diacylglycerol kinase family protein [Alkalibacillus haloalkaliphilus]
MKNDRVGFKYAIAGVYSALKTEHNIKIHFIIMFMTLFAGLLLGLTRIEWLFVLLAIGLVLALELINTVVELITDVLFEGKHETAKLIKDISAAAVLVAATFAALVGMIIFLPKLLEILI